MESNFVRTVWILLRKAAQVAIAGVLAAAWLAAPIPAHAQQLSSPIERDQITPARAPVVKTASLADSTAPARMLDRRNTAPHFAAPSDQAARWWLIAAVLSASLLGSAGLGWRLLAAHRLAQKARARRVVSSGSARAVRSKSYEQEQLGVETWLPAAPKLSHARLMVTQPVRAMASAFSAHITSAVPLPFPRDFDTAAFERDAKVLFMRLTTAWDAQDQSALRSLIAPYAFDALVRALALEEKGAGGVNVLTLEAQVLRVTMQPAPATAEVRFFGLYRAESSPAAGRFDCVWSLSDEHGGWHITAIQSL